MNPLKAEDGDVDFVAFIKISRLSHLGIYLTLFLKQKDPILQEMMIGYLNSK